ncbi:MAG TPA: ABC transporter permease, partial [Polyangiaceae bacterium]|nr:ABC transporter permease [Polyangiaceae bacterium]
MISRENFRIAIQGILTNRLRSLLTMLGIMIGVASVIILVAVGTGSSAAVQSQLQSLGTNLLTVTRAGGFRGFGGIARGGGRSQNGTQSRFSSLTATDVAALRNRQNVPDALSVNPVIRVQSATMTFGSATYSPSQFVGTSAGYFSAANWQIATGRAFTQADETNRSRVIDLGQTVVTNLFGSQNPVGQTVQVNGHNFLVIGTLKSKGSNGPLDSDDIAIAPIEAVQDTLTGPTASYDQIVIEAKSANATTAAQGEITATLLSTHKVTASNADFQVLNQASFLQASSASNRTFTVLLGAVAAISLLVGGIGVMNIMLVTVTERTREIGIRKAIGARKAHILGQFMIEAVLLSMLGGVV